MRACAVVPAFQAERSVGDVVRSLVAVWPFDDAIFVVDDGSTDRTAEIARAAGARVVSHGKNRGKGAALRTGLDAAKLQTAMNTPRAEQELGNNVELARTLGFTGTPSWVVGNQVLSGAVGYDALKKAVAVARERRS